MKIESKPIDHFQTKYIFRSLCGLLILAIMSASFLYVWRQYIGGIQGLSHLTGIGSLALSLFLYVVLAYMVMHWIGGFKIGVNRRTNVVASQILGAFLTDFMDVFISLAVIGNFRLFFPVLGRYLLLALFQSAVLTAVTVPLISLYRKVIPPLTVVEIYGDKASSAPSDKMNAIPYKFRVMERIQCPDDCKELKDVLVKYDAVLLNDLEDERQSSLIKMCFALNERVYYSPKLSDIIISAADTINLIDTPLDLNRNNGISLWRLGVKRFFDIFISLLALIILSPAFGIVALCIKAEDGGPVFYHQERVTKDGKIFRMVNYHTP